jgi:hypothetical protein
MGRRVRVVSWRGAGLMVMGTVSRAEGEMISGWLI